MSAKRVNLTIEKGATFSQEFIWRDLAGNIVDNTGYTARMHIRRKENSSDIELSLTTENNRIAVGGSNGKVTINIAAADTNEFTWKQAFYDLELVSGATVVRFIFGIIDVSQQITR